VGGMRSARINMAVQEKRRHPEAERVTISVLAPLEGATSTDVGVRLGSTCAGSQLRSAAANRLPFEFFARVIWQESRFDPMQ
jgi:hypothetical protein